MEGGKLTTGLNCLHSFNNEKRHHIKSGVEKDVLHLVEDLHRLMAKYKATYQIGTKSTTSEARKTKEHRKKGEKKRSSQLVKTEEKKHALFFVSWEEPPLLRTLTRTYLVFPNWKTVDCETVHLLKSKTDRACLRDLCRANLSGLLDLRVKKTVL